MFRTLECLQHVTGQVHRLWSKDMVRCMFDRVLAWDQPQTAAVVAQADTAHSSNDLAVSLKSQFIYVSVII